MRGDLAQLELVGIELQDLGRVLIELGHDMKEGHSFSSTSVGLASLRVNRHPRAASVRERTERPRGARIPRRLP